MKSTVYQNNSSVEIFINILDQGKDKYLAWRQSRGIGTFNQRQWLIDKTILPILLRSTRHNVKKGQI